jgi:hypothetical protein
MWLESRAPAAPAELRDDMVGGLGPLTATGPELADALAHAARARLAAALERPGRVRASAFHLLAADALLTYACEAALELDDPRAALLRIIEVGASP